MGCRLSVPLYIASKEKKSHSGQNSIIQLNSKVQDFGSKEEIFFDSQAWLESDCEDDFFSVNGEFTPSRGSTPIYQTSTSSTPSFNKAFLTDKSSSSKPEPSPTGRKKLAAFLQENLQDDESSNEQNDAYAKVEFNGKQDVDHVGPKLSNRIPYYNASSVCSSQVTQKTQPKTLIEKTGKAMKCCLPSLA